MSARTQEVLGAPHRDKAERFLSDLCRRHPRMLWMIGHASAASLVVYFACLAFLPQMDFRVYRMGAQHLFGVGLYSSELSVLGRHLFFTYPPVAALLFWPISHFSTYAGQTIWDALDILLLTVLIAVSIAAAQKRRVVRADWRTALILLGPIGFFLYPVRSNLVLGQINIVLVLLILVDLTMTPSWHGKRLPRGVLVGLAAAVKLTPLIFIPYLAVSGQWRDARRASASFVLATGVMFVVAPKASWQYFTKDAYDVRRVGNSAVLGNQTLHAAIVRSHFGVDSAVLVCVLGVMLCGGIVVAAWAYRRSSAMLGMLVCAATGLMISPISWLHHYVWIVPVLIWLVCGLDRPPGGAWWALAGAFVFAIVPQVHAEGVLRFVQSNSYVLATLTFIVLTAVMLRRRKAAREGVGTAPLETSPVGVLGFSGRPEPAWPGPSSHARPDVPIGVQCASLD